MAAAMAALAFEQAVVRFGAATVVGGVSLVVEQGSFVSVVGPTGCGKSTLLNLAAGLLAPSEGSVFSLGTEVGGVNRNCGYLFQGESLMPWRNARDNVAAGLIFAGTAKAAARAQAEVWLTRVGLHSAGDKYPHQMSGGMRKRAQLAQTLILDPPILLMDEPFSALDVQTRLMMENELLTLWQGDGSTPRKTVLFITHDLEEAISLSDRVVVLSAGPASKLIADFAIDLPRPRDVAEIRHNAAFQQAHKQIWDVLRSEVLRAYRQQVAA
jgi:NitT/TauT family transport system ATP-binding protein